MTYKGKISYYASLPLPSVGAIELHQGCHIVTEYFIMGATGISLHKIYLFKNHYIQAI